MKNLKKLTVLVLALCLLLSSFTTTYADEISNGDNSNPNSDIGLFNDSPDLHDNND
jgi:uncharacterized protein YycO